MLTAQRESVAGTLLERVSDARHRSDALFDIVRAEAIYDRPIRERHRIIFYIGHLEAFDWNLLHKDTLGLSAVHPEFDRLFAFGIDPVGGGLPTDLPKDWPAVSDVREYVAAVRHALDEGLEARMLSETPGEFPLSLLLQVAIEHRLMHAETLAYMLHQLPLDRKTPPQLKPELVLGPGMPAIIEIPAGRATLGLRREDASSFGWDNEYQEHTVEVPGFAIDQFPVTNQQYLEFVKAGGYENSGFWSPEGWDWKTRNNISDPGFWRNHTGVWYFAG